MSTNGYFHKVLEGEDSLRFLKNFPFGHAIAEIVGEALLWLGEPEFRLP